MAYFSTSERSRARRTPPVDFEHVFGRLALVASFAFVVAVIISH